MQIGTAFISVKREGQTVISSRGEYGERWRGKVPRDSSRTAPIDIH